MRVAWGEKTPLEPYEETGNSRVSPGLIIVQYPTPRRPSIVRNLTHLCNECFVKKKKKADPFLQVANELQDIPLVKKERCKHINSIHVNAENILEGTSIIGRILRGRLEVRNRRKH